MKTFFIFILALFITTPAEAKKRKLSKKQPPHSTHAAKRKQARKACIKDYRGISGEELNKCIDVRSMPKNIK